MAGNNGAKSMVWDYFGRIDYLELTIPRPRILVFSRYIRTDAHTTLAAPHAFLS